MSQAGSREEEVEGTGEHPVMVRSAAAIVVLDTAGQCLFVGGGDPATTTGLEASWLEELPSGEAARVRSALAAAIENGAASARLQLSPGAARRNVSLTSLMASDGRRAVCVFAAVHTAAESARDLFLDKVQDLLSSKTGALAVAVVDLPEFRRVVSGLGMSGADALLDAVHERIVSTLGERAIVHRIGPSEFGLLIPNADDEELVQAWMEDLHEEMRAPYRVHGRDVALRNAVGLASTRRGYTDAGPLLSDAETAALHANVRDASGAAVFRTAIREEDRRVIEVAGALRGAVQRGEMHLVYQPILTLRDQSIVGFEALLRWQSPRLGPVGPDEFIPIAEKIGWVSELDTWVMRAACSWAAAAQGDFSMSVNVSARWSDDTALVTHVAATLAETGFPASRLRIELTETALARDAVTSGAVLRGLRDVGVSLAMDDFGTGYSSLRTLADLPLDVLKIDRSFVQPLETDERARDIVRAVIAMGQFLRMQIVAEGIETDGQREMLTEMGCDFGQGYFFDRPLAPEDALTRLTTSTR
ncbi:MAG: EAL domain-containing protein [Myxococcales bacterium]|nr:EAL domain-containing protein [Myxococcales bacterium]MCB9628511.1 EAL domain-containing protein [Sandaracinaceae bacterium]